MTQNVIRVRGAREHNLKNIDVEIPRDKLVVITGLSGSGKSSLAFDTIFAEGQRRYVESLSAYARQFLGQLEKPDVDQIEGLSPAVSIDQKGVSNNPRSTVGTVTEIYDYLRLLFARVGVPHCPTCGRPVERQTAQQIVDTIADYPDGSRLMILAPLIRDRKGHHQSVFEDIRKAGFARMRVDGRVYDVEETPELDRYKMHTIEAVVDRIVVRKMEDSEEATEFHSRLTDSVETALKLGGGSLVVNHLGDESDRLFSEHFACPYDGTSLPEIEPRSFSFNSPHGACPACQGLGTQLEVDPELILPNPRLSLNDGGLDVMEWRPGQSDGGYYWMTLEAACKKYNIPMDVPIEKLTEQQRNIILYGSDGEKVAVKFAAPDGSERIWHTAYEGVVNNLTRRFRETTSDYVREKIMQYMSERPCPECHGKRVNPVALGVTVGEHNIYDLTQWSILKILAWATANFYGEPRSIRNGTVRYQFDPVPFSEAQRRIAHPILKEIRARLQFMVDVGLDYLTLSRSAGSLSGGEGQRIRLATQIGSQLMGVLYVLDEPSIGLHQRDNERLIHTLQGLRDLGNTLLVVEHDDDTIRAADWIIDMGPGAGVNGGQVVAEGTVHQILNDPNSLTGAYLSGRRYIAVPDERRLGNGKWLSIYGARENNLKNIDVHIPLGRLVCITGVSGSGKSSFMNEILFKVLARDLNGAKTVPGKFDRIEGLEHLDKVINIDQSPIGRTPRSNPATYVGLFDEIRKLFAELPESKLRGYKAGRFSFNVKGGRCEACQGQGQIQIEMQFLPDIFVPCEVCHGARYNRETLQVRFKGLNIAEVLDLPIETAVTVFANFPPMARRLETLVEVGLGYIKLGQSATTLSGGEAQRVKLSKELSKRSTGRTIYVLDEPSVGLHAADVHRLIEVLNRFVDEGNTVVIIEHHPDIIKVADYLIDLGPEGGDMGGQIIAEGTPEMVANHPDSYTGHFLKRYLTQPRLTASPAD